MFKKMIASCTIVVLVMVNILVLPVFAVTDDTQYDSVLVNKIEQKTDLFKLKAKGAVLIDATSGNVLFEENSHEKLPIASVTKIMTMLLTLEEIDSGKMKFTDMTSVSPYAISIGGSQLYFKEGEQFSIKDMMKAVAIHSANDAAVVLAEKIAGSEEAFVTLMNKKAQELGMKDSDFKDCNGLSDEGVSSAYDVALMSKEILTKHPEIIDFATKWSDTLRDGKTALYNRNKMVRYYDGATGLKTGFTGKAGQCLSFSAKRGNLHLIAVVLGEPDVSTRYAETRKLLDYGFANFELKQVNKKNDLVKKIEVKKGVQTNVNGIYQKDVNLLLKKGDNAKVDKEIKLNSNITAPIKKGQKLGEVIFKSNGREVGRETIVAASKVEKGSAVRLFFRMVLKWVGVGKG